MKKNTIGITDIILIIISAVFLIGIRTFFSPCGPKDDGSWMTCHWAGQAISGIAAVILVIAVCHAIFKDPGTKTGLSIAIVPLSLFAAVLPGNLIGLCMMNDMRCHSMMRTDTVIFSVLLILISIADILVQKKKS